MAGKRALVERAKTGKRKAIARNLFEKRALDRSYSVKPRAKNAFQRFIRKFKGSVKFGAGWPRYRGVSEYESVLDLKPGELKELIKGRVQGAKNRKVNILDIGCGTGVFLAQLKKEFGERVNAEGIVLARPLSVPSVQRLEKKVLNGKTDNPEVRSWLGVMGSESLAFSKRVRDSKIKVHTGLAETHDYGKKFDLIFSSETLMYAVNPLQALENSLNHLKLGGKAFLHFGTSNPLRKKSTVEALRAQGIEVKALGKWAYCFTRKTNKETRLK